MSQSQNCLNCGTPLTGGYCSHCGQPADTGRITFKETFLHFLSSAFSVEGKFWVTFKGLFVNPGRVFREYTAGRRASYYKPVAFFILITAIYIILRSLLGYDPVRDQVKRIADPGEHEAVQRMAVAATFFYKNATNLMFMLVFSIGLSYKLFFRKRYNLAEYVSMGFYLASMYTIVSTIWMFVVTYLGLPHNWIMFMLAALIYYGIASLIQVYRFGYLLKYLLAPILSVPLYIILGFGFSYLWVWAFG